MRSSSNSIAEAGSFSGLAEGCDCFFWIAALKKEYMGFSFGFLGEACSFCDFGLSWVDFLRDGR